MELFSGNATYLGRRQERYPPLAFDGNIEAPVYLIEVGSGGNSRRMEVTQRLVAEYIEKDFGVSRSFRLGRSVVHDADNFMQRLSADQTVAEAASSINRDTLKML
jgi:hypothetical protein